MVKALEETTNGKDYEIRYLEKLNGRMKEVFVGLIPTGSYQTQLSNGENNGLVVELYNDSKKIIMNFGTVLAVRMFDEGIVQKELYSDKEIEKYKKNRFHNIIYEVTGSELIKQIQNLLS